VLGINVFAAEPGHIENKHLQDKVSVCSTADTV